MIIIHWILPFLRWLSWVFLSFGLALEIFVIRETVERVTSRLLAQQTINLEQSGQPVDLGLLSGFINFGLVLFTFLVGIGMVSLTVAFDYYLRAGEKKGRLFQRIALLTGLELGVYFLAVLIQWIASTF